MENEFYRYNYLKVIESLRNKNFNISICVTGGGTGFITELLQHGGMSEKVYDVQVPYSQLALEQYLGFGPQKCCSRETALCMAETSLLTNPSDRTKTNAIGLGLTCSLTRHECERDGRENVAYLAIVSTEQTLELKFDLKLLSNDTCRFLSHIQLNRRILQEDLISSLTFKSLADFLGVEYTEKLILSSLYGTGPTPA